MVAQQEARKAVGPEAAMQAEIAKNSLGLITIIQQGVMAKPEFGLAVMALYHGRSDRANPKPLGPVAFPVGKYAYVYQYHRGPEKLGPDVTPASAELSIEKYEITEVDGKPTMGRRVAAMRLGSAFGENSDESIHDFRGGVAWVKVEPDPKADGQDTKPVTGMDAYGVITEHFGDLYPPEVLKAARKASSAQA